jgi:FkbM family methyltransferase
MKLSRSIRLFADRVLEKKGWSIRPLDKYADNLEVVRYEWLKAYNFKTVIDVGASNGGFASRARTWFPEAQIYSFEPLPDTYEVLCKRFAADNKFKAFNTALSTKEGTTTFHRSSNDGSSSLLEMGEKHRTVYPESSRLTQLTVNLSTMDKVLGNELLNGPILLKLDVQGAELDVLRGGLEVLSKANIIFTEISFTTLYNGQSLASELIRFLDDNGYELTGMENISHDLKNGQCLQADAFFTKRP